jgi:uncharacterized membrane protein
MQGDILGPQSGETWTPESGAIGDPGWKDEPFVRTGALLGAGTAVWLAARSGRPAAVAGAALAVFPLAMRGLTGRWPFREPLNGCAAVPIRASLVIARSPEDVFDAWREFGRLPERLKYVVRVNEIGPGRTEWVVRTPAGRELRLRSMLVRERRPRTMSWHSLPDSDVEQRGSIDFRAGRGGDSTRVHVRLEVVPPPGARAAGTVFRSVLVAQVREDLRRFRSFLESGAPTSPSEALSPVSSWSSF